jgi:broad specificity phosphatase PhoE
LTALHVALVRHGVTDWNEQGRLLGRAEIELNERGRAQAAAVAAALRDWPLDAVLASPQRRAQETAAPIAAAHGLAVATEPDLAEVWVGRWQGKTSDELRDDPDAMRYAADGAHECAVIEDAPSVQRRIVAALERVRAGAFGSHVCLVSHGDPLRLLLAYCLGTELAAFRRLRVDLGSLSLVRCGRQRIEVLSVNRRPSADGAAPPWE